MNRWPHQEFAVAEIARLRDEGERLILLTSPTGGGKTLMACDLIEMGLERFEKVCLYTNRKMLTEQTARVMEKHGIRHGVRAAGWEPDLQADVQVASIQTEHSKTKRVARELHQASLVLIDEIHMNKGDMAQKIMQTHLDAGATIVGITATPVDMGTICGVTPRLVIAGRNSELRKCGALVPALHYGPSEPDTRKVRKQVWEYTEADVRKMMMVQGIFGLVLSEWKRLNPEQLPTLLFAPGVPESIWFAEQFRAAGVRSAHIDGAQCWLDGEFHGSDRDIRDKIVDECRNGSVKVICNRFVCLDEQTEILTRQGWIGIDDMTPEHDVANWNDGQVFFAKPRKVLRRHRDVGERMVVLETPRRSIRVTANHQMLYRTTMDGQFFKCAASDLIWRAVSLPVSGVARPSDVTINQPNMMKNMARRITANAYAMRSRGFDADESRREAERRIRERCDLQYKQPSELSDDECEFIGFWLGDGGKTKLASGGIEYRMWQGFDCPKIIERIDDLCRSIGTHFIRRVLITENGTKVAQWSLPRGTGFGMQKRVGLFSLEPYLDKSGAELLWGFSISQFAALIRGLWMADGFPHGDCIETPNSRLMICAGPKRQRLFDLLQAIAVCRGYRASIRRHKQSRSEHEFLVLSLTKETAHRLTKHPLRIEEGWKRERVWCVESTSGNIITRRKGSVTVMGNCREGIDLPWLRCGIFATVFSSVQAYIQSGGRLLRAFPGKDHAIVIDHGGNWHKHGSLNADRDWNQDFTRTEGQIQGTRIDRMREKKEGEPFLCPKCKKVLTSSTCLCGFVVTRKSRPVAQADGRVVEHEGEIYKPHKVSMKSDTEKIWLSCYYRAMNSSNGMSFRQAVGLFFRENYYYPPKDLPMMPKSELDWYRKVKDVPRERLNEYGTAQE